MANFLFWAISSHGIGISGGDRIYIEFAKRWSKKIPLKIITWHEGINMMQRNGLFPSKKISFLCLPIGSYGFFVTYILRIIIGLLNSITIVIINPKDTYLYSASEFWMDSFPCFILKLRYPELTWIASWYQTAPSPLVGFKEGSRKDAYRLNALVLWLTQLPVRSIIGHFADNVLVNNELEKQVFPKKNTLVVLGAVDTKKIDTWLKKNKKTKKRYAAVFQGRFHPQKGVLELIDIWRLVVDKAPSANLVMIGDGSLMPQVKKRIRQLKLMDHVNLPGFVFDGPQKYKLFSQSKIVVHPAFFDSGGMASAEAMAFGLPAVGFDLPAYKFYYPKGFIKVEIGDITSFANQILSLLSHSRKRIGLGKIAEKFVHESYTWDFRARQVLGQILDSKKLK